MNKYISLGRLIRDPELKSFSTGSSVCNFGLAVNNRKKNQQTGQFEDDPVFLDCEAWSGDKRDIAKAIAESCKKGDRLLVDGHLKADNWTDKTSGQKRSKIKLVVDNFTFIEAKRQPGGAPDAEVVEPDVEPPDPF